MTTAGRELRARIAVSAGFAAQGFVFALLLNSLARFESRFGIGDGAVTVVVLGVCLMAAGGTWAADRLAQGSGGSRRALVCGLVTVAVAVLLVAAAPSFGALVAAFAVYGVGLGLVDAGTNMQAVAVQRAYGTSLLTSFYAAWSAAGILGALLAAAIAGDVHGALAPTVTALAAVVPVAAAFVVHRGAWREPVVAPAGASGGPASQGGDARPPAATQVPWGPVLVLGLGVVAYYVADQAVATWSTIYLQKVLDAAARVAPLGYAAYLATTLVARLFGDRCVRRWGRADVVRVAASIGAAGLLAVVVAPGSAVALVGFAVTGAGLGVIAPLCFSAAGDVTPGSADAVVARLNVFNYVGAVLGGVLVGAIGTGSTLRLGFVVPLALVLVVLVSARRFGDHGRLPAARLPVDSEGAR